MAKCPPLQIASLTMGLLFLLKCWQTEYKPFRSSTTYNRVSENNCTVSLSYRGSMFCVKHVYFRQPQTASQCCNADVQQPRLDVAGENCQASPRRGYTIKWITLIFRYNFIIHTLSHANELCTVIWKLNFDDSLLIVDYYFRVLR